MLHLLRVLIFGLVFTCISILSAMRGVVHPAHAPHKQCETVAAPASLGAVSSQHHGADAMQE